MHGTWWSYDVCELGWGLLTFDPMAGEIDEILSVVEARLRYLREIEEISLSCEEGEVQLTQMCQWIALLGPFIPEADLLL